MNSLRSLRCLVTCVFGILSLMATMGSSAPLSSPTLAQSASDVSITMVADRNMARAGQTITYTVTMTNLGPDNVTFVDVAFALPDGLQGLEDGCDLGVSADGPFCEYSSLPAGATVVSTFSATPLTGTGMRARLVRATASILFENADASDPNIANNTATVKTKLIGRLSSP
jgi:uncharacterized repeat protein (TIGR01451 family)